MPTTVDTTEQPARTFSPVFLLETELLEPPAVGYSPAFKPAAVFETGESDSSAGRYAGFFVTLATRDAAALRMRLLDLERGFSVDFEQVAPPATEGERELASHPRPFSDIARQLLGAGNGLYWLADSSGGELRGRFAVLIPEPLLSPFTKLQMFTDAAADGTALGVAEIELVREFFYLAVIGDSVQWGNGLEEKDKMSSLASEAIERETGKKVIQQRFAHSGARIVPADGDSICEVNCIGEVPTAWTSITVQVDLILRPDLVDFILMDGCINDVGVPSIIDPGTEAEELGELARSFCGDEMVVLLRKVRSVAPQAYIVVTGYYPIVGLESDPFGLRQWAMAEEVELADEDTELVGAMAANSLLFRDVAHESIRAAIDAVNADGGNGPMIAFADPGFGVENAVFGPERWLWSMSSVSQQFEGLDLGLELFPEDPIEALRLASCFEVDVEPDVLSCIYASVGHPNPTGARAYAAAVIGALREFGILPLISPGD